MKTSSKILKVIFRELSDSYLEEKQVTNQILDDLDANLLKQDGFTVVPWQNKSFNKQNLYSIALTEDDALTYYYQQIVKAKCLGQDTFKISMPKCIISKLSDQGFCITILHSTLEFATMEVVVNLKKALLRDSIAQWLLLAA